MKSLTRKILIGFAFILIAIPLTIYSYMRWSLPILDGEINWGKNLKEEVHIYRDQMGVPHIYAQNNHDAYFSLGYTIASERLFQMEMSRRVASGELSEIIGEKALSSDKTFKNLKIRRTMEEMYARKLSRGELDPKMLEEINAFYAGVNYYQDTRPLPIEFKVLNIRPRPFTVIDGYSFLGLMSFSFAIALNQEPLLSRLEKRIGSALVDDMRADKMEGKKRELVSTITKEHDKTVEHVLKHSKISEVISMLEGNGLPLFEGSNGWLVGKKRSSSGSNILVNDPHITHTQPGIWFEAHIHTPEIENYGHFLPLIPFPILAHNRDRGWGFTMSLTDDMDLYQEKREGDSYFFKNEKLPLKVVHEKIKVKGQSDFEFDLAETIHGPIIDQITEEKNLAVKWAFLDSNNDPIWPLYLMGKARNIEEFSHAVSLGIAPGLNVLYADKENIAWWLFGKVSMRKSNTPSDFILDGASGKDEYVGEMKFLDRPHAVNPDSGIIVSANARPVGFPKDQRGDWQPNDRFDTIASVLSKKEKWGVEETKELQTLNMNFDNKLIKTALVEDLEQNSFINKNADFRPYIDMLKEWDLNSDLDSHRVTLFQVFFNNIGKNLMTDFTEAEKETFGKMATGYTFLKRVVLNRESPWWKKFNREEIIGKSFIQTIKNLQDRFGKDVTHWTWGKLHTLEYNHPLGKVKPLNYLFNLGPYPLSGATHDVNNQKSVVFKDLFEVKAGPSTRRIIDMGNPEMAQGILPVGESGHLLSPYYKNQVRDYLDGRYRPMLIDREMILKNQSHHVIARP